MNTLTLEQAAEALRQAKQTVADVSKRQEAARMAGREADAAMMDALWKVSEAQAALQRAVGGCDLDIPWFKPVPVVHEAPPAIEQER